MFPAGFKGKLKKIIIFAIKWYLKGLNIHFSPAYRSRNTVSHGDPSGLDLEETGVPPSFLLQTPSLSDQNQAGRNLTPLLP